MLLMRSGLAAQGKNIFAELFFFALNSLPCSLHRLAWAAGLLFNGATGRRSLGIVLVGWRGNWSPEHGGRRGRRQSDEPSSWNSKRELALSIRVPPSLPLKFRRRQRPDKKGNLESQREKRSFGRLTFFRILLMFFSGLVLDLLFVAPSPLAPSWSSVVASRQSRSWEEGGVEEVGFGGGSRKKKAIIISSSLRSTCLRSAAVIHAVVADRTNVVWQYF